MKKNCLVFSLIVALPVLTGCVDNNYDLSDIDTTSEFKVKDLTLPINLDVITLDNIIDSEDSEIKIININGKDFYAVSQSGDFEADKIEVKSFTATAPNINPIVSVFRLKGSENAPVISKIAAVQSADVTSTYFLYSSPNQDIDYTASSIDKSLVSLEYLSFAPLKIDIKLSAIGLAGNSSMSFKKIIMNFVKGLTLNSLPSNYNYEPKTGLLTITDLKCTDNKADVVLTAVGVDPTASGSKIENHTLNFNSSINIKEAELEVKTTLEEGIAVSPEIQFNVNTTVGDIVAKTFSGQVKYSLDGNGLKIDPVMLDNIPDFLNDEHTNIILSNPQIYINTTNPVAAYKLSIRTGLELTAVRGAESNTYSPDNNETVNIGYANGTGPYNFVLSPSLPKNPLNEYSNGIQHVAFSKLSEVLSGDGLPSQINVELVKPEVPLQYVENFPLGVNLPAMKGKYDLLAPLSLERNSKIIYTDTEDGWGDNDLAKLTITSFELSAIATSKIPLEAKFTVTPLYKNDFDDENEEAKPIPGVKGETTLPANATDYPVTVTINGDIRNLDGIKLTVIAEPQSDNALLEPTQTIILKNVRATVSGSYITE